MARWITIKDKAVPFDYRWPDRTAITAFTIAGEHFVKDEVADFAISQGFATEGKAEDSTTRSTKGKTTRRSSAKKAAKEPAVAATADNGPIDGVAEPHLPDDDRAADRRAVDQNAG